MKRVRRVRWSAVILAVCAFGGPAAAYGSSDSGPGAPRIVYDLIVLRPLDLVQVVTHAAFFPLAYPFSLAAGRSASEFVRDACLTQPLARAFRRPLGEL